MRNANLMRKWIASVVLLAGFGFSFAQMTVSGNITDAQGLPVIENEVSVVGNESIKTQTDLNGDYTLTIPASAAQNGKVSVISKYDGAEKINSFDYVEGSNATQSFAFTSEIKEEKLKEVVAVGYGSIKREVATGAVDVVKADGFQKGYVSNADQLIQGKVAGVVITSDGSPQGGSAIRIRGGSSLNAKNDPLIILDGLPLDSGVGIGFLNPNDIESVSVLKDASATAIYGTRGSNGVIIYTTKKGGKGDWKVNYNAQFSINTIPNTYDVLSAADYTNLVRNTNWGAVTDANNPVNFLGVANDPSNPFTGGRTLYDTDWLDQILNNSMSTMHNITFSGNAFNRIPTRISAGYTGNNGTLITSKYERLTTSLALNPTFFNNTLKVNVNVNAIHDKTRYADTGQISNALAFDPTKPVYQSGLPFGNGFFEWTNPTATGTNPNNYYLNLSTHNPVAALKQKNEVQPSNRYFGNVELDYKLWFFPDVRAVVRAGIDQEIWNREITTDFGSLNGYNGGVANTSNRFIGSSEYKHGINENKSLDAYLNYDHTFNELKVDITGGYAYQKFYNRYYESGNYNDPNYNLRNEIDKTSYDFSKNYITVGFFGRANLVYKDRYLLTANYRYDGTSRFGKNYRWESFPGISVGWIVSKEGFWGQNSNINTLKIRAAYGKVGNQSIDSYQFIPLYGLGSPQSQYFFGVDANGNPKGYNPLFPKYYNDQLRWETTSDYNAGIDYGILNNKITGSFDVYYKKTEDLLARVAIAPGANFANKDVDNLGDFTNKGIEMSINYKAIDTEKLNLDFNFNASFNEREVTRLGNGSNQGVADIGFSQSINYNAVGQSPETFWLYEQVYDANEKPIEGVFVDRNNDGTINDDDRYFGGNPFPKFTFGLRTNLSYGNFDFTMNWRANLKFDIYDQLSASNVYLKNINNADNNFLVNISDNYNDVLFNQSSIFNRESDYFVRDGSFLKLDNVTLGYNFKEAFGKGTSCRISASGNNLLIITESDVIDPEQFNGIYNTPYPRARIYTLGLNLNF